MVAKLHFSLSHRQNLIVNLYQGDRKGAPVPYTGISNTRHVRIGYGRTLAVALVKRYTSNRGSAALHKPMRNRS